MGMIITKRMMMVRMIIAKRMMMVGLIITKRLIMVGMTKATMKMAMMGMRQTMSATPAKASVTYTLRLSPISTRRTE